MYSSTLPNVVRQTQEIQEGTNSGMERDCTPTSGYGHSVSFRGKSEPIVATFATQYVQEKHHTEKIAANI